MKKIKKVPDADLPNAGGDFHILWVMKKSCELLNFEDNGLKCMYVEGVDENTSKIDLTGEYFLGVDISEYYGGETFEEATQIVISQLKYSTRRVNENITFSELNEGKKGKLNDGSIIHRLANIFKKLVIEFGIENVKEKVTIKLVSNRRLNPAHLKAFNEFKSIQELTKNQVAFDKIKLASKLNNEEFEVFIKLLDFEDCGADNRINLKLKLINSISKFGHSNPDKFSGLKSMVWDKMMPEESDKISKKINLYSLLGCFHTDLEGIFPVPQKFNTNENIIPREQLKDIICTIENNTTFLPICLHGGAGMGKSTIVQQIANNLPEYSECFLFDCYAKGEYLNSDNQRHKAQYALKQLANEIAKKIGSDFLIPENNNTDDGYYIREFSKRIKQAISILKDINPKAYLTIIIDAADNSITASKDKGETSFVELLLGVTHIEGLNLILTTRSGRKDKIPFREHPIDIELKPFSSNETEKYIKAFFSEITEKEILDFHNYTNGIPRVQSYVIDLKEKGISEIINYLKPNGKTVEDLILDKIKETEKKLGKDGQFFIDNFFKFLIALPRPVPIIYLANILNKPFEELEDFASDIWLGLDYDYKNKKFSFRDEDFETYLKETYSLPKEEFGKIANQFVSKANEDEYASIHLGNMLYLSENKEQLNQIVLDRQYLNLPKDPIRIKETYISRIKYALKLCNILDDNIILFKLLFIAGEEAKSEKALNELLFNNPELVTQFGDIASLTKLNSQSENKMWAGSFHLKMAGLYSRRSEDNLRIYHLDIAKKWHEWVRTLKDEERRNYNFSYEDIAYEAEAYLNFGGVEAAFNSMNRWNPKKVLYYSGNILVENIIVNYTDIQINEWLKSSFRVDVQIFIVCKQFQNEIEIKEDLNGLAEKAIRVLKVKRITFESTFYELLIAFCEVLAYCKVGSKLIAEILNHCEFKAPIAIPYFSEYEKDVTKKMDLFYRKETLKSFLQSTEISVELLYPETFKNVDKINSKRKDSIEEEKKEYTLFFEFVLRVYLLKAKILTHTISEDGIKAEIEKLCKDINHWDFRYRYERNLTGRLTYLASILFEGIQIYELENTELITLILNNFKHKEYNQIELRLQLISKLNKSSAFHKLCLQYLAEVDNLIQNNEKLAANEIKGYYIECTNLSKSIDEETGRCYYKKAITALDDIDFSTISKINCIYELTELGIGNENPKLAYEFGRFIEFCKIKLGGYDDKHFPYTEGLKGIFNLEKQSLLSTASRWNQRGILDLRDYILFILNTALEQKTIDYKVASSLIPLSFNNGWFELRNKFYNNLLDSFDVDNNIEGKNYFVATFFRDFQLNKENTFQTLKTLYPKLETGKFTKPTLLSKIKEYIDFRESFEQKSKENAYQDEESEHNIDIKILDFNSTEQLEKTILSIGEGKPFFNFKAAEKLLIDIQSKCQPNQIIGFLNAMIDIDTDSQDEHGYRVLSFYSIEKVLELTFNEWSFYSPLADWKANKFEYVLKTKFNHFISGDYLNKRGILKLAEMFSIHDETLIKIFIGILPEKIEYLSTEAVYNSIELIKNRMNKKENEEIIDWVLKRSNETIKENFADGIFTESIIPTESTNKSIASLLRCILGHPDKRIRWKAIHSIRRLINSGNIEILKLLLADQNKIECFPFQDEKSLFYWISAKLYLWIAIERISNEVPERLIDFSKAFYVELLNTDLPHVLIQFYIQKTCLNLCKHSNSIYNFEEMQNIENVFLGTERKEEEVKEYKLGFRGHYISHSKEWKFPFDTMDVLEYNYRELGNLFNINEDKIADLAEKYIIDQWNYSDAIKDEAYIRQLRDDYTLTRSYKGSLATVEDVRTYFEYHALYCVAGDLIKKSIVVGSVAFYEWLEDKANCFSDFWLSDLRDSMPLELNYWKQEYEKYDKNWVENIEDKKFEKLVCVNDNFINVYSSINKYFGDNSEKMDIESSLISTNLTKEQILEATTISTENDSFDIYPFENGQYFNEKKPLNQKSWLKYIHTGKEGLDNHDLISNNLTKGFVVLGDIIRENFNLTFKNFEKDTYFEEKLISNYVIWNEIEDRNSFSRFESFGETLKIEISFLSKLLEKINKSLLIECKIVRGIDEKDYTNWKKYHKHRKYFLVSATGIIEKIN